MASATTQKFVNNLQLHDHLGVTSMILRGGDRLSTQTKTVETDDLTQAELEAALESYTYDAEWRPSQEERDWRAVLQSEITFLQNQLASWPADATNNTTALTLVNFLSAAVKREGRDLLRVLKHIRDNTLDSEA